MDNRESMIVVCSSCGGPGKVVWDTEAEMIVDSIFVCKCPRSSRVKPSDIGSH
jgi:hypothetical protein